MASSSPSASLTSPCIARTFPPSTLPAIGSRDLRARGLNCPTIELKNWSRGSCRVKHARKAVWNPRSSSIKASISLRVSANWGMANGSSAVRQAGNIFCLLVLLLVYGNRYQENGHVSIFRCRCRVILPHLSMPKRGPKCKLGYYRVFNLILRILYTGMQWKCLPLPTDAQGNPAIHYTTVYKVFAKWADDGSLWQAFVASVRH